MALPALHKYVAEFFGTFLLVLAVSLAFEYDIGIAAPVAAAVTLTLLVYAIGPVSGAHVNPAVTIGLLGIGKITLPETVRYLLAQLLGATLAIGIREFISQDFPALSGETHLAEYVAEFMGAFVLTFGVATVALGKAERAASGLIVGGALFIGIVLAAPFSFGLLNPAVALGFQVASLPYIVSPILGALAGAQLRKYLG